MEVEKDHATLRNEHKPRERKHRGARLTTLPDYRDANRLILRICLVCFHFVKRLTLL